LAIVTASNPAKLERQNSYHSNRYEHDGLTVLQKNKRIRIILVIVLFRARIENDGNFITNASSIVTLTYVMMLCHLVERFQVRQNGLIFKCSLRQISW